MSRRIPLSLSSQLKLKSFGLQIESIRNVNANLSFCLSRMSFSSKDGSGSGKDKDNNNEDPFGVNFQDKSNTNNSNGNIGPKESLPPNYIRDSATGKFTGEIVVEASQEDKKMLNLGPIAQENLLKKRIEEYISRDDILDKKNGSSDGGSYSMANVARRIREEDVAFNTLGRKVTDLQLALEHNRKTAATSSTSNSSSTNAAAPLSADELASLHKFMEQTSPNRNSNTKRDNNKGNRDRDNNESSSDSITQLLIDESQDLIPNIARQSSTKTPTRAPIRTNINNNDEDDDENNLKDNPDMDLQWLSASAQRQMQSPDLDTTDLSDPFTNLMPSDLNPSKKINRRQAKPIPKQLIHHNNLSLLRRYVTPGGQIMNRTQSRLGAKDQRKVAKLVKRARHLGLIPVLGQWKFEDKGNVRDVSLMVDRDWETRLVERGLVEKKSKAWEKMEMEMKSKNASKQGTAVPNGW